MKMSPVVHFEMPAEDRERVAKFYRESFGWDVQLLGEEFGNYVLANTTETDPATQTARTPGAINGGFFKKGEYGNIPHVVISVDDIVKQIEVIKANGGRVEGEVSDIPGIGKFAMFVDTEGNYVGLLQPSPRS